MLPGREFLGANHLDFGALESAASGTGIAARARDLSKGSRPPGDLERLRAEDVFEAARNRQAWAEKIVAETVDYLVIALVNLTAVLDPGLIVLGGGVARSADLLIGPIMERMVGLIPNPPKILVSTLGMRATVLGAATSLFQNTSSSYVVHKRS